MSNLPAFARPSGRSSRDRRPPRSRRRRRGVAVLAALATSTTLGAAAVTSGQASGAAPDADKTPRNTVQSLLGAPVGFADIDARVGSVLPTAAQRDRVSALGARVRWNRFGTPQTLIKDGGYLATGLSGNPRQVARTWLSNNAALFRLSPAVVAALPARVNPLVDGGGTSVSFTQTWNGVPSVRDGVVTLGIKGGKVAVVTSSSVGSRTAPTPSTLGPREAWLKAAANVGRQVSGGALSGLKTMPNTWRSFSVKGFTSAQYVRPVVVPLPKGGVHAGYEAIVVDNAAGDPLAYSVVVDGTSGAVWLRQNLVDHSEQQNVVQADFTDTACGDPVPGGTVDAATRQIVVSMSAAVATNDIVVKLLKNNTVVASEDTGIGTEALRYAPTGGVPAGDYFVQVCPFDDSDTPFVAPFTAAGVFVSSDTATPDATVPTPRWSYEFNSPSLDYANADNRSLGCWTAITGAGCDRIEKNLASRAPWDVDIASGLPSFTTVGNNAVTAESFISPLTPGPFGTRPVHPDRDYTDDFTNGWHESGCDPTAIVPGPTNGTDVLAATTNLFAGHNHFHDFSYFLGFTEDNYNAQVSNFGNNSAGQGDPETGNVQAGAQGGGFPAYMGRDNANQIALPDGIPGITNQYLFQPIAGAFYSPCVDGDLDASIFGHEYTHLISNRMVGGPQANLSGEQAGSMGESWSDLNAVEYLHAFGYTPLGNENPWAVGAYATGNKRKGIRDYALNNNPLNFSDIGFDTTGPEVHADGEIWNGVNYDIRQALVAKYDAKFPSSNAALQRQCAEGVLPSTKCPGNRRWIQLVFDAWLLQPAADTMLDARDTMLAADLMRYGGANQKALWSAFAKRGFGVKASTTSTDDVDPIADYVAGAGSRAGTVDFKADVVDTGAGLVPAGGVKIYVGRFEAGVTPFAVTDASGRARVKMEPGTYRLILQKPGLGLQRDTVTVPARTRIRQPIHMQTNLLSATNGSTVTQSTNSTDAAGLIDDTEDTNWSDEGAAPVDTTRPSVTVHLGGTAAGPKTIRSVRVSAYLRPGQNRFSALRKFRIDACVATTLDPSCALPTSFHPVYTSADDAFPAVRPRPVAPDLQIRTFDTPDFAATYLKLVALQSQCTGTPGYRGEQDNDPLNATDCVTGSAANPALGAAGNDVRAAEFQAFGFDRTTPPPNDPVVPVSMTAPASAVKGSTIEYTIGYRNLGPAAADNALLTDRLPAGLTFVSAAGAKYTRDNRTVTWALGSVPAGATATKTLTVKVTAAAGSGVLNQADFAADATTGIPGAAFTLVTGP